MLHARPIIIKARVLVRLPKYLRGDVIDQYLSKDKVKRLSIDAVLAV